MKMCLLAVATLIIVIMFGCEKETGVETTVIPPEPIVSIFTPSSSEVNGDSITIQVSASDDKGIIKVEIYIDNLIPAHGTIVVPPYNFLWNVDTLEDNSTHLLYAKAYDADGNISSTPVKNVVINRLSMLNLQFTLTNDSSAQLAWDDLSRIETGFQIEQRINQGPYQLVKTMGPNIKTADILGDFFVGDSIYFRGRAVQGTNLGKYSVANGKKLSFLPPTDLRVVSFSSKAVELSWKDNSSFELNFALFAGTDTANMTLFHVTPKNATSSSSIYSFDTTKVYYFKVRAFTSRNTSAFSNVTAIKFYDSSSFATKNIKVSPAYYSFTSKDTVSREANWDMMFTVDSVMNPIMKLNRDRGIKAAYVDGFSFAHLDPYSVLNLQTDPSETSLAIGAAIFKYAGPPTHKLLPYTDRTFVIQLANSRRVKFRMESYYNPSGASGFVTFNYVMK